MKRLTFLLIFALFTFAVRAQTAPSTDAKLDSLAKLSQRFINNNQPDSLYALMGDRFKQQISPDKMKEAIGQITGQLGKWTALEAQGVKDGIGHYKATFALAPIDFFISQNEQGKIETFMLKPQQ